MKKIDSAQVTYLTELINAEEKFFLSFTSPLNDVIRNMQKKILKSLPKQKSTEDFIQSVNTLYAENRNELKENHILCVQFSSIFAWSSFDINKTANIKKQVERISHYWEYLKFKLAQLLLYTGDSNFVLPIFDDTAAKVFAEINKNTPVDKNYIDGVFAEFLDLTKEPRVVTFRGSLSWKSYKEQLRKYTSNVKNLRHLMETYAEFGVDQEDTLLLLDEVSLFSVGHSTNSVVPWEVTTPNNTPHVNKKSRLESEINSLNNYTEICDYLRKESNLIDAEIRKLKDENIEVIRLKGEIEAKMSKLKADIIDNDNSLPSWFEDS